MGTSFVSWTVGAVGAVGSFATGRCARVKPRTQIPYFWWGRVVGCVGCRCRVPPLPTCGQGVTPNGRHGIRQRLAGQQKTPSVGGWGGVPRVEHLKRVKSVRIGFQIPTTAALRQIRRVPRWRKRRRHARCRSRPRSRDLCRYIGQRSRSSYECGFSWLQRYQIIVIDWLNRHNCGALAGETLAPIRGANFFDFEAVAVVLAAKVLIMPPIP